MLLTFKNYSRKANQVYVIGDEKWKQYPVDFDIIFTLNPDFNVDSFVSLDDDHPDFNEIKIALSDIEEIKVDGKVVKATIHVKDNPYVRCLALLPKSYDVGKIELVVLSWSEKNTNAKIMYISNDLSISFSGNDISEITVLEEKTGTVEELSYGITSNACTVKVSNNNERFIKCRDLLRANRVIQPYINCLKKNADGSISQQSASLGKFYSDSWEISSESNFISCKAYDILFNLQSMQLVYNMEPINNNELFPCVIDGAKYGKNGTAYKVFEKIFKLINQEKQYNGIFGNDIEYDIDPKLQSISMDVVLLGSDTAWNMLQQMANFCLSNVFVDRDGKVKVVRDVFVGEDQTPATRNASLQVPSITPNNAFSYDLPAMAKTMVNKAVVPYVVIKEETASETIQTTIEKKDFIIKRDSAGVAKFILAQQKFDSNLFKINDVEIRIDGVFTSISTLKSFKLAFGCIALELDYSVNIKSINIVLLNSENVFKSESQNVLEEDFSCQAQNGVKTFELGCGNLITSLDIAKEVAEKLIANYSKGKTYIESTWIGTPEMKLGLNFTSYSMRDKTPQEYDCLSNEFTITGGMRLRTKARQK